MEICCVLGFSYVLGLPPPPSPPAGDRSDTLRGFNEGRRSGLGRDSRAQTTRQGEDGHGIVQGKQRSAQGVNPAARCAPQGEE